MAGVFLSAQTYWRLGLLNLWRVGLYKVKLVLGIHPVQRLSRKLNGEVFFDAPQQQLNLPTHTRWKESAVYFGCHRFPFGNCPPDWHLNPFTGVRISCASKPWWHISDFQSGAGDIKTVWETSRFEWVIAFAQRAVTGHQQDLVRLNMWLNDWVNQNPAYYGANWKCGQEVSIRVMNLLMALRFLQQDASPRQELVNLIEAHLARISMTVDYALAQDNNHCTSEAVALFLGGTWLLKNGLNAGYRWSKLGRKLLETGVRYLIEPTGSFSQHSVNYHRFMLDTLSTAELWRSWLEQAPFSDEFYDRAIAATHWLRAMTDSRTGDVPNLGANDGANLLPLTDADYRDYRPSVELAANLFLGQSIYPNVIHVQDHLAWLSVNNPVKSHNTRVDVDNFKTSIFRSAGYIVLYRGPWKALFRYPFYRFRPGHSDALHVDLWHFSKNLTRDAGSFSYHSNLTINECFTGCTGHNTVQFDDHDSMPSVSRFLRGKWLNVEGLTVSSTPLKDCIYAGAGYRDWKGARHYRKVELSDLGLRVTDRLRGFKKYALLRWRLPLGNWVLTEQSLTDQTYTIKIESTVSIEMIRLVTGWESRYYLQRQPVTVLEVRIIQPGQIITLIRENS